MSISTDDLCRNRARTRTKSSRTLSKWSPSMTSLSTSARLRIYRRNSRSRGSRPSSQRRKRSCSRSLTPRSIIRSLLAPTRRRCMSRLCSTLRSTRRRTRMTVCCSILTRRDRQHGRLQDCLWSFISPSLFHSGSALKQRPRATGCTSRQRSTCVLSWTFLCSLTLDFTVRASWSIIDRKSLLTT